MSEEQLIQLLSQLMTKPKIITYPTYQEVALGNLKAKLPIVNSVVAISQVGQFG